MAIHPIDLQTLYAQMEKVGRQQGAEQQLAANAQEAQQEKNKLEAEKRLSSVQVIEQGNQENLKINKDGKQNSEERETTKKKKESVVPEEDAAQKKDEYIKDPYLGQRIDISG